MSDVLRLSDHKGVALIFKRVFLQCRPHFVSL